VATDRGQALTIRELTDTVLPSFSLPGTPGGRLVTEVSELGGETSDIPVEIRKALEEHWSSEAAIEDSINSIRIARTVQSHPKEPAQLALSDWTWRDHDVYRDVKAHENCFLAWQLGGTKVANRARAFEREIGDGGLTEAEFLAPRPDAERLSGEWATGSDLVVPNVSSSIIVLSSNAFDHECREFVSLPLVLHVPMVPSATPVALDTNQITVKFEEGSPLRFAVERRVLDRDLSRLDLHGVIRGRVEVIASGFEFVPEVFSAAVDYPVSLKHLVIPTLERRFLMLPLKGTGFLVGTKLRYLGPTEFDSSGLPQDQVDAYDADKIDFAVDAGEEVHVVAWSGATPSAIEITPFNGPQPSVETTRQTIRWSGDVVGLSDSVSVSQKDV
jgi:hypothetical protein